MKLKLKLDLRASDVHFFGLINFVQTIASGASSLLTFGQRDVVSPSVPRSRSTIGKKRTLNGGLLQFHPLSLPRIDDGYTDRLIGRSVARRHDEPSRGRNRGDVAVRCWESSPAGL